MKKEIKITINISKTNYDGLNMLIQNNDISSIEEGINLAIELLVKQKRKEAGLTQEEFAMRSGLGLRFVRDLEQGKETVRMDKVNQALAMFGMKAVPGRKDES